MNVPSSIIKGKVRTHHAKRQNQRSVAIRTANHRGHPKIDRLHQSLQQLTTLEQQQTHQ